ncbi:MAG: hypothetical protein IKQ39_00985 [Oscillospiraceae bacterium]|nr:hypothetical protein [Oscillospiraceae bacterium]
MKNKDTLLDVFGDADEKFIPALTSGKKKNSILKWAALGGVCAAVIIACTIAFPIINHKHQNTVIDSTGEQNINSSEADIALEQDDINIYYLDGTEIKSVSEFLPCAPKYIFESWKSYNHIGSEVQLINVKCSNNGTEGSDSSVAYYQAGDYFILNITVSANLRDYYDTVPEDKLLESLKLTMISYLNIDIDEYNLILE